MSTARRWLGIGVRGLILWVLVAAVFWVVVEVLPGFENVSFRAALFATGLMTLFTVALWPLLIRIVLPLTVLTFGLASLALNAVLVAAAMTIVDGETPHPRDAIAAAFMLSLALMFLSPLLSFDDDARQLRIVRRRMRKVREQNRTDVPGVILFEIDGLAEPVLRRALEAGHVPVMKRWLDDGSHRLIGWECDLSSQTGASQAGLLLGSNEDMPAFRWYEKDTGHTMVSNHGKDAVEMEARHSDGGGLLAVGGASRGNMFSGDAPHCSATMSVLRDKERSGSKEYFAYFGDPFALTRTIARFFWDVILERRAARRQRKAGADQSTSGGSGGSRACSTAAGRAFQCSTSLIGAPIWRPPSRRRSRRRAALRWLVTRSNRPWNGPAPRLATKVRKPLCPRSRWRTCCGSWGPNEPGADIGAAGCDAGPVSVATGARQPGRSRDPVRGGIAADQVPVPAVSGRGRTECRGTGITRRTAGKVRPDPRGGAAAPFEAVSRGIRANRRSIADGNIARSGALEPVAGLVRHTSCLARMAHRSSTMRARGPRRPRS